MTTIESRLEALGINLPTPSQPLANYVAYTLAGNMLYISGQLPMRDGGLAYSGTLGKDIIIDEAVEASKLCAINILAQAKSALGDLERIRQIVKLGGFVASDPLFLDHPKIINGASDFMVEALGDRGRHTRFAVGVACLPLGAPVEIDAMIEIV